MRHPTPLATPVAPAPPVAPYQVSREAPELRGAVLILTPEGEFEFHGGVAIIGRDETCKIPLRDDLASRQHACVRLSEGVVTIQDLESTNGVYLNGVRLAAHPLPLREGDRLLIGTTEISVFALRVRAPRSGSMPA